MWRFSGLVSGGHDSEGRQVSDGANGGRADPGSSEQSTRNVEHAQQDDVPVKTAALLTLVHQDKPGTKEKKALGIQRFN